MVNNNKLKFVSKLTVLNILCFVTVFECRDVSTSTPEFGNRILNGMTADDHQFPYQVSLQKLEMHNCGGSIISDDKVLTAGHCLTDDYGNRLRTSLLRILCGTNHLNYEDPEKYFSVNRFAIHPKYDRNTIQYDYGVVFIDGNFNLTSERISVIPMATEDPTPGTVCYISGWGDVDITLAKVIPNELQFGKVTIDPAAVCKEIFPRDFVSTRMICAGQSNKENAGAGDSGGPLVCDGELSGVLSFGRAYDDSKYPDVYSSVAYAFDWINTTNAAVAERYTSGGFCYLTTFTVLFITQIIILTQSYNLFCFFKN